MKIILVRHAEPDYAIDSLTEKGWREAKLLADRMEKLPIDDFYLSPLGRAQDTARETLRRRGQTAETLDWLQEFRAEVLDPTEGTRRYGWDLMPQYVTRCEELYDREGWKRNPLYAATDAGHWQEVTARGLDELLTRYGFVRDGALYRTDGRFRGTICLFCHFAISMVIIAHLQNVSPIPLMQGIILPPSSITTLFTEERVPGEAWFRIGALGDTSHLYAAGEPVSHSGRFPEHPGEDDPPDVL